MNRSRIRPKKIIVLIIAVVALAAVWWVGTKITSSLASKSTHKARPVASTPAARNELRRDHLDQLATAISKYTAEVGPLPVKLPAQATGICAGTGAVCRTTKTVDLMFLTGKDSLTALPSDPTGGYERGSTGYKINRDSSGSVILSAPRAEDGQVITETAQ